MKYTLNKAAKLSGRAKSTISKAIKDGRLSAGKNKNGGYEIDASELFRVFPIPVENQPEGPQENTRSDSKDRVLEVELEAERKMRERLEAEVDDLRTQRDKWQDQAQRLLLTNQNQTEARGGKRGLFGFLRR